MATGVVSRCGCGARKSQYANKCRKCADRQHQESVAKAQAVVATGKCPQCGAGLRRNLALTGWWQCEQYGDGHFRKDQTKPACSFQCFTA